MVLLTDYVFQSEDDLRYAMVSVAAVAGPVSLALIYVAVKPYREAYRELSAEDRCVRPCW